MSGWELCREATNAAGACSTALRRFRPPRLLGREAFSQDQSVTGAPVITSRVSGPHGRVQAFCGLDEVRWWTTAEDM